MYSCCNLISNPWKVLKVFLAEFLEKFPKGSLEDLMKVPWKVFMKCLKELSIETLENFLKSSAEDFFFEIARKLRGRFS